MQRFLIIAMNCALLVMLLIGLPAAARAQLGNWQVSPAATGRLLMFCGLGTAVAANLFAALVLVKARKPRILCWEWAAVFSGLLLAYYGYTHGYFNFLWLRHALQWLQKRL